MSLIGAIVEAIIKDDLDKLKELWDIGVINSMHKPGGYDSGFYAIHFAVLYNHCDILKYMLENGAHPNAITVDYNDTPIMVAFEWAGTDVDMDKVQLLLIHGANPYIKDKHGATLFACRGHKDYELRYLESYLVVELVTGEADNLFLDVWRVIKPFLYTL